MRVAEIIALWPSPSDFADDVGVTLQRVSLWKHRDFIPPEHWTAIEEGADRRDIAGASASDLARRAASRAAERTGDGTATPAAGHAA